MTGLFGILMGPVERRATGSRPFYIPATSQGWPEASCDLEHLQGQDNKKYGLRAMPSQYSSLCSVHQWRKKASSALDPFKPLDAESGSL